MRLHRSIPAALLLSTVVLLGGCSTISNLIGGEQAVRDADTGQVTESGKADAFTIKIGDCFNDQSASTITDVPAVPCSDPHDNEVYHEVTMPDGEFPGDSAITDAAEKGCGEAFASFIGIPAENSTLSFSYLTPTRDGWEGANDRLISCIAYDPAGKVTGTLAGAAR
ncbi:septum formation family protein [Microbacterium sp. VKM Ac-2870]|uniref:septum formation family protein n=1 Tax=Microbacterium sp. VKM Ac-2870 TaxID=2783825 RepID=UPI00188D4BB9|nr:septum formation family protein [Microbacterium sp. VKM Ac-2870]MBF4562638.1 septum formation family protein [Microbacterium sp. VKM Ac-2870]